MSNKQNKETENKLKTILKSNMHNLKGRDKIYLV